MSSAFGDETYRYGLDDCGWWDQPANQRPWWARADCSGRMDDTSTGVLCEEHYNAQPER